jgi:hypothetical protein
MVPLINNAGRTLRWFIEDVWGHFDTDHTRPGAPLFPSERKNADGTCRRVGDDALRAGLAEATAVYLPAWADKLSPHVLRHYCASELYLSGMDLISIQEALGPENVIRRPGLVAPGGPGESPPGSHSCIVRGRPGSAGEPLPMGGLGDDGAVLGGEASP